METGIKPIKKHNIAEEVFEQLKNNIIKRVWTPGTKIPAENELAAMFGVSRVSIRAAIQKLVALGLLEAKVGEGTYVKELTPTVFFNSLIPSLVLSSRDDREILELRRGIETESVRLAAERATPEDIARIEQIFYKMNEYKKNNNIDAYVVEDYKFHIEISKISQNNILVEVMLILKELLIVHFADMIKGFGPDVGFDYHKGIIDAIKVKDAELASSYVQQLITILLAHVNDNEK